MNAPIQACFRRSEHMRVVIQRRQHTSNAANRSIQMVPYAASSMTVILFI